MCNETSSSLKILGLSTIIEARTEKKVPPERGRHPPTFVLSEFPIPAKKFFFTMKQNIETSSHKRLNDTTTNVRRQQDESILYHIFTARVRISVNEPFPDAKNLSNIDFVYHFEQLGRITERLPVVSPVKNLEKPFVIPETVCVCDVQGLLYFCWRKLRQFGK